MTSAKLYIYFGVGAKDLYIDGAHMALDIVRFAVFFLYELNKNPVLLVKLNRCLPN